MLPENKYAMISENSDVSKTENNDVWFLAKSKLNYIVVKNCFPVFHPVATTG